MWRDDTNDFGFKKNSGLDKGFKGQRLAENAENFEFV